jgi:hypothetical protein
LFDGIRSAAQWVAGRSRSVRIDPRRLREYAQTLPIEEIQNPALDASAHVLARGRDTVAFFLTLDAVNFGSGWFPVLSKRPGLSGYFTVATSLKAWFETSGVPNARDLAVLTPDRCAAIFGQDREGEAMELMVLFARALNDLGALVEGSFDGSFTALVESADNSAEKLARTLSAMPLYQDVATYDDRIVPFFKRAQLTAADLWLAFSGREWGRFDDIESLTIFADSLVPHVLRLDGVLVYDPDLARRIDAGELIVPQSGEEVEIRANAVAAVEQLVSILAGLGRRTSARRLDYWLWNRGGRPEFKAIPRHRARTAFY